MKSVPQNFTIVVNWRKKGFGCGKACSYCTWRDSALLPHGGQSTNAISAFITQCKKSFITISGGADPLYRFEEYGEELRTMIDTVRQHGFRVRIITREVAHVSKLKGIVDFVSISLDTEVLEAIKPFQAEWKCMDIEYSLVLPPLPTEDIVRLKPQYAALRRTLGKRLVLRENLNSIFPLDMQRLSFGHSGIVFVPKKLCLGSRYLSTIDCIGHDIVQDNEGLAAYLMGHPDVHLFGGFVKHLVNPRVHIDYNDIDVIALDTSVMSTLGQRFGFAFTEVSESSSYPRYFIGKSTRAGKAIQLVLMNSLSDVRQFINNAQYDADRISYSNSIFHFDSTVGEHAIRDGINTKTASRIPGQRTTTLFNIHRPQIEQKHKAKLLRKGFIVND
jgi:hypothetical protein